MHCHGLAQWNLNLIFKVKLTCLFSELGRLPVVAALAHVSPNSASLSYVLLNGHWKGLVHLYCRTTTGHCASVPVVHCHKTTTDHCAVPSLGGRVVLPLFLSHRRRPVAY